MGLFGRKKISEKVKNDRQLISENERSIEALIILSGDDNELIQQFREIKETIKYLTPSNEDKIYDFDKKIKNLIEDTRIILIKANGETGKKVDNAILQIKLAISDRNAKL